MKLIPNLAKSWACNECFWILITRTKLEEPVIEEEENGDDSDTGSVDQGEQIPPLEERP